LHYFHGFVGFSVWEDYGVCKSIENGGVLWNIMEWYRWQQQQQQQQHQQQQKDEMR